MGLTAVFFVVIIGLFSIQRLWELRIAKRNVETLFKKGAIEFGESHYGLMIALHVSFFVSLILEAIFRGVHLVWFWPAMFGVFILAQLGRVWIMKTMRGRWTTRILVVPGERLIQEGPFRWVSHPNYCVVAMELFSLPACFGLWDTAFLFSALNALVLFCVRIPEEKKALQWSQEKVSRP